MPVPPLSSSSITQSSNTTITPIPTKAKGKGKQPSTFSPQATARTHRSPRYGAIASAYDDDYRVAETSAAASLHSLPSSRPQTPAARSLLSSDNESDSMDSAPSYEKENDRDAKQARELNPNGGRGELYYSESDADSTEHLAGVSKVEAAQSVWGPRSKWVFFIGIGLSSYIYSLDGTTTWQYLNYATSSVLEHSVSGSIATANAIIIAVGKPLMAKLADVVGRAEAFIAVTLLYVIGYIVIASADDVGTIAAGQVVYSFGYTGLQMLQQIVIADATSLRYRGLVTGLVSAPFILNNFVAGFIAESILPNWRWGYGMFAILVPVSLLPIILTLLWAQWKARQMRGKRVKPVTSGRWYARWGRTLLRGAIDMDLLGLLLIAASLALILLPLGLAPKASRGWHTPSMLAMIIIGAILFPIMLVFEWKVPAKPVVPMRWLRRGPILGACLIGFFDFVSFYLQYTYLYSYVYVTQGWSYRNLTFFSATQSLALTIFGILAGFIMYATQRFKWMLFAGLLIRLLGVGLMVHARSPSGNTASLVLCQVLQGLGGGFAAIAIQVSAQAAVAHVDVATVTAMVLLITEVGNSVGSAVATEVWSTYMPRQLAIHVPTTNQTLLNDLFGSITQIALYPEGDPIREGAIAAYQNIMYRLVLGAVIVAIFPPIFCLLFTRDVKLSRAQNALDGKDLEGRQTDEANDVEDGRAGAPLTHGREA